MFKAGQKVWFFDAGKEVIRKGTVVCRGGTDEEGDTTNRNQWWIGDAHRSMAVHKDYIVEIDKLEQLKKLVERIFFAKQEIHTKLAEQYRNKKVRVVK